ncbi:winged helix-turn-helix transcriptional regulator [Azohydromonas caseinilytica]|uniref:Response regulator transcription factor n=1 Tax=Azohydromonas caseinilytica TaxID=2728836 RepID=A0A848FHH4_9BURK|nr:response regulator transcription factor [Azohydromonas caseinilytica]NML18295.1 response regulator transcription factor [Azohydromonas caseinilytica]
MPRSVLVIIENPAIRELVASHLQHARLLPLLAASAQEGRRLAGEVRPDAVLVDADSPAAAAWLDATQEAANEDPAPTLVLSSQVRQESGTPAGAAGRRLWMSKPFAPREVVRCLGEQLSSRPAAPVPAEATLRLGPLALDTLRHEVRITRGQKVDIVSLPRAELELLRCLMEHQGRVVSREQIIAATWGPDHSVDVRTVDQNIKRLRKHLDGGRGRSMIQTHRGYGYRLNFGPDGAAG